MDLCLDMPDFEEDLIRTACHFVLPEFREAWSGYRENFNGGIEQKLGMTLAEMDAIFANEGREAFMEKVTAVPTKTHQHWKALSRKWTTWVCAGV